MHFRADSSTAAALVERAVSPDGGYTLLRPRVLDVLTRGLHQPLTLLSAPAGFGKTVALRQLLEMSAPARREGPTPGWRTAGAGRDAARVSAVMPFASGVLEGPDGVPTVVVDQSAFPAGAGSAERLDAAIKAFVARSAAEAHFLVACRPGTAVGGYPPSGSPGLVVGGADLAFTPDEAAQLVEEMTGRDLSGDHLAALMAWSEGWPVAVRRVAMAIRGGADIEEAVGGGGAAGRYIAAFVRHEILDREPEELRRFMARTSVLREFDPELCRALDDRTDAEEAIGRLGRERLVIRWPPTVAGSYEYFGPVREVLRKELREREPASEVRLLRSAASWLGTHDQPELAVPYLVESEQWDDLMDLIDRHGPRLHQLGLLEQVLGWLGAVPLSSGHLMRQVGIRQVVALTFLGESGRAEQVSRALRHQALSPGEQAVMDTLRAVRASQDARPSDAVGASTLALEELDALTGGIPPVLGLGGRDDLIWMASTALVRAYWQLGDLPSGRAVFSALMEGSESQPELGADAIGAMALAEAWAGNHETARYWASRVLSPTADRSRARPDPFASARASSASADAALALAHVCREEGDLAGAGDWLASPYLVERRSRSMLSAAVFAIEKSIWCLAMGRPGAGLQEIRILEMWSWAPLPPFLEGRIRSAEVRLQLLQGEAARAESVLLNVPLPWTPCLAAASVQAAVVASDMDLASRRLGDWPEEGADRLSDAERELWTAVVDFDAGRRRQALRRAGRLASIAEERRYVRMFLDGGPPVLRLLRSTAKLAPGSYAAALAVSGVTGPPADAAPSGLSAREREIIRYLPTPLSSAQMAAVSGMTV